MSRPNRRHIQFSTDSFNDKSIKHLSNELFNLGIENTITIIKNRTSEGKRINIYKKESQYIFYNYIGPCPVKSFNYKW